MLLEPETLERRNNLLALIDKFTKAADEAQDPQDAAAWSEAAANAARAYAELSRWPCSLFGQPGIVGTDALPYRPGGL